MRKICIFLFFLLVFGSVPTARAVDDDVYYKQMEAYKNINANENAAIKDEGDDLYMQQMRSYKKLYADYNKKLEERKRLEHEIANFQKVHDNMLRNIEKLQKKYEKMQGDYDVNVNLRNEWEGQFKAFEQESVQLNEEFWQKQKNYGVYQKKMAILKSQQEEALRRIKRYEQKAVNMSRKMKKTDQDILKVSEDAKDLKEALRVKQKKLDFLDMPTRKR